MIAAGFLDEVRALRAAGYGPALKPLQALGYKQLGAVLDGDRVAGRRRRRDDPGDVRLRAPPAHWFRKQDAARRFEDTPRLEDGGRDQASARHEDLMAAGVRVLRDRRRRRARDDGADATTTWPRSWTRGRCSRATCWSCRARHVPTLYDVPPAALGTLFAAVQRDRARGRGGLGVDGTFVAMNNKVSQSVPHLHVHVVPRKRKDGLRGFFWPRVTLRRRRRARSVRREDSRRALAAPARSAGSRLPKKQ
jgi:diadenosine tetraphosphate (Ap4A) HIT family hydrolase